MVSARQFNLLSEMGISVWQRKPTTKEQAKPTELANTANTSAPVDLAALFTSQFFNDVLTSLSLSQGDVSISLSEHGEVINLGFFNWRLANEIEQVTVENNCLLSPTIEQLMANSALKKSLWQQIQSSNLLN